VAALDVDVISGPVEIYFQGQRTGVGSVRAKGQLVPAKCNLPGLSTSVKKVWDRGRGENVICRVARVVKFGPENSYNTSFGPRELPDNETELYGELSEAGSAWYWHLESKVCSLVRAIDR